MARRGDQLREHILWAAKDVFLELGFERASMDAVASRAETSKRSLYVHFESKEKLFLAVIELVRGLVLSRLKSPSDYSERPAEALVIFCGRYLEIMIYESAIQMCRLTMAEAAKFPEGASKYFDVLFTEVHDRLTGYIEKTFALSKRASAKAAQKLVGQILYPTFPRALFGVDRLAKGSDDDLIGPHVDLRPVRKAVSELIQSLPKRPRQA